MLIKNRNSILLGLTSIIFTLYTYRSVFESKLLGDPFDARLMIVLHEHWWRWINGLVSLRDTEFFYPYSTALGYSDVFLVQGFIYALFRFLGNDLGTSWTYATFLLLLIGNLGWVVVAKKYLQSNIVRFIFILTIISSLSFVNFFTLNPNIVGYTYLSWLSLIYLNLSNEKKSSMKQFKFSIFIILMLIYTFSCWYGAFFLSFTIVVKEIFSSIVQNKYLKFNFRNINYKIITLFLPIQIFFVWLFYYIYISVSNQPLRPAEEMIRNSPRIQLLANGANVNGAELNGSFFRKIYEFLNLNHEQEYTLGVGFFIFVALISFLLKNIYDNRYKLINLSWSFSVLVVYLFFVVYGQDLSLFSFFFEYIPGLNSIRYPSRYVIFVGYFSIFGIFYLTDQYINKNKVNKKSIFAIFFLLILLLDQQRSSYRGWSKIELVNSGLQSQKEEIIKNCDYFYYDYPGGWWYDQIEAITFGIQVGIPTVNGYSGAFPPGYPTESFDSEKIPLKIFEWIEKIDKNKRGCFVTGISPIRYFNEDLKNVDLVGFTSLETKGEQTWQWAVSPNPYLFIFNSTKKDLNLSFELKPNICQLSQKIRITEVPNKDIYDGVIQKEGLKFNRTLDFNRDIVKRLEIITDSPVCKIPGDPRDLFFEIKNLKYN